MADRTVWVPHLPTRYDEATKKNVPAIDLNNATAHGRLETMAPAGTPRHEIMMDLPDRIEEVEPDDAIICVGDVAIIATSIALLMNRDGCANILRWDRNEKCYHEERITLPEEFS